MVGDDSLSILRREDQVNVKLGERLGHEIGVNFPALFQSAILAAALAQGLQAWAGILRPFRPAASLKKV